MSKPGKNTKSRWIAALVAIVVLLIILGGIGQATGFIGKKQRPVRVEVVQAEVKNLTQLVTASGKAQPEVEIKMSPDVSGEIIALAVKEGDWVERGQLLVRIKPDFYVAQTEQAQAGVLQARAEQSRARADLMKAELDLKRQQELFERKVVSESDFQTAQTQHEIARAGHEAAQYRVESAEARYREAREQLAKTTIFAPMSGTVSKLNVAVGERVVGTSQMAGTEMMRIARLDQMELEVEINENDVVNITLGDSAAIEIDAYPERTFRGVVTEIANSARISGAGTQEQVTNFPVKVRILDTHNSGTQASATPPAVREEVRIPEDAFVANLRPGMSGTVDIFTRTVFDAVAVPIQAVTVRDFARLDAGEDRQRESTTLAAKEDLRRVVFVVEDGKAQMLQVETGISDDTHIEIRAGLSGEESVIVGPYRILSRELKADTPVQTGSEGRRGRSVAMAAN